MFLLCADISHTVGNPEQYWTTIFREQCEPSEALGAVQVVSGGTALEQAEKLSEFQ